VGVGPDVEPIERQSSAVAPALIGRYGIWLVLGVGLLARILYWARMSPDYVPLSDAIHYDELATNIANGMGYAHKFPQLTAHPTAFRPPLYPVLLGGVYKVFGHNLVAGRVLSLVLGMGVVLLAFLLVRRIAGWRAAMVTGLLVAVYPPLLANDTFLLTESLSLLLTGGPGRGCSAVCSS
jgi:dolichyl-phosphate-mannose--protein O-mannosyl transferase